MAAVVLVTLRLVAGLRLRLLVKLKCSERVPQVIICSRTHSQLAQFAGEVARYLRARDTERSEKTKR